MATGVAFYHPINKPLASLTKALPLSTYVFTVLGAPTTQALVYQDAYLKIPYKGNPLADGAGNFRPIYLDPKIQYQVQLVDQNGIAQYPPTTYLPPCPTLGTGPVQVNASTGEVTIGPPTMGAGDAALSLIRNGTFALNCPGNPSQPSAPLLQFLNTLISGATAANYAAVSNKPGSASSAPSLWLPILGNSGVTYYIPLWS